MQKKGKAKNSSLKKYIVADRYDGMALEEYLKTVMEVSARQRQKLFFSRGVYVNGVSAHTKRALKAGDMVAIRQFKDTSYGVTPEEGNLDIIYEDNDVIVVNKPAEILVHPAGRTESGTLANYLAGYFKQKKQIVTIRPVHRLDRDTTGCVLFAKSGKMQTTLEKILAEGKIHRSYEAVIVGAGSKLVEECPQGIIEAPIAKDVFRPNRRVVASGGQRAVTHFQVLKEGQSFSLLSLWLETGRTHQIRVHLAYSGYPVVGDKMYGRADKSLGRQALHAAALEFIHPLTGEKLKLRAKRPEDFQHLIDNI
ncbi:MAG: RluA family pseudouridine synthase [Veillonellaceae bacterium]|nr:RluA family pseudouridine synthase [Veillonellaceae bacterium]